MKKKLYIKPSSCVVRLNIKDQLLNKFMGNSAGAQVTTGEGGYSGDDQGAKQHTLFDDEEEGWEAYPKPHNPWDEYVNLNIVKAGSAHTGPAFLLDHKSNI